MYCVHKARVGKKEGIYLYLAIQQMRSVHPINKEWSAKVAQTEAIRAQLSEEINDYLHGNYSFVGGDAGDYIFILYILDFRSIQLIFTNS